MNISLNEQRAGTAQLARPEPNGCHDDRPAQRYATSDEREDTMEHGGAPAGERSKQTVAVRRATPIDAAAIATVHVRAWKWAYDLSNSLRSSG